VRFINDEEHTDNMEIRDAVEHHQEKKEAKKEAKEQAEQAKQQEQK
jgi:hypothetical protein